MRKPYKTPTAGKTSLKPLIISGLSESEKGVLSGSNTKKRAYLETI